MSYTNEKFNGGIDARQDITAGGKIIGMHGGEIQGDLTVSGAVRSPYVSSANMGMFKSETALKKNVPNPTIGMYATVGSTFPAELYICIEKGTWTDTDTTVTFDAPTAQIQAMMQSAAQALILDEELRAEYQEQVLDTKIDKEVTDRKWDADHLKDMCRRLAVLLMTRKMKCSHKGGKDCHGDCMNCHHCCCCDTDPDWLWQELLLGIRMDTENDILTIGGVEYKLTRLHPNALQTPYYELNDISDTRYSWAKAGSGAAYQVTLMTKDTGVTIKYKIIKDTVESAAWITYDRAIVVTEEGTYKIRFKTVSDELESEEVLTEEFTVTSQSQVTKNAFSLAYPSTTSTNAVTLKPTVTCNFTLIKTDGTKQTLGLDDMTSVVYEEINLDGAALSPNTGEEGWVIVPAASYTAGRSMQVKLTITLPDGSQYSTNSNIFTQPKIGQIAPTLNWATVTANGTTVAVSGNAISIDSGATVKAKASGTSGCTITYKDANGNTLTQDSEGFVSIANISAATKITAYINADGGNAAYTTNVSIPLTISVKAVTIKAACGVSDSVPTTATVSSSNGTLTISGTAGKVQWVAIPSSATITSWYDNDESYEMKTEISEGTTFTSGGVTYKIYYNQVRVAETKNFTIKFS